LSLERTERGHVTNMTNYARLGRHWTANKHVQRSESVPADSRFVRVT
jgi:hypothetical protein